MVIIDSSISLNELKAIINIRPSQQNFSRGVDGAEIREKIVRIVNSLVK